MSELQFAKQFLTTLDNKSIKYQSDHVFDPKTFQLRIPYTLPKLTNPPHPLPPKSQSTLTTTTIPGSETTQPEISILLKSNKNPNMSLTIPSINPISTTIQSLKEQVQSHLGGSSIVGIDKIKILSNKKPIPISKRTISDALDGNIKEKEIEFGIMIIGGAPDPVISNNKNNNTEQEVTAIATSAPESEQANLEAQQSGDNDKMIGIDTVQQDEKELLSGKKILETKEFWTDLQGFLEQRLKDTNDATSVRKTFEEHWKTSNSKS